MSDRATTPEDVVRIVGEWQAGIGPNELHVALGWSAGELERYHETGDLPTEPAEQETAVATQITEGAQELESALNPFLEGATVPHDDAHSEAFWEHYTRWRVQSTGDGQYKVIGEHGQEDAEGPRRHNDQALAQRRADELNSAEQMSAINANKES